MVEHKSAGGDRQEDLKLEADLGCTSRACWENQRKKGLRRERRELASSVEFLLFFEHVTHVLVCLGVDQRLMLGIVPITLHFTC